MHIILCLSLLSYESYFLTLYTGGQQPVIGGANVAIAEDAFGAFYNPAGLAFQKSLNIGFERHAIPWFGDLFGGTGLNRPLYWVTSMNLPLNNKLCFGVYGSGMKAKYVVWDFDTIVWKDFTAGLLIAYQVNDFIGFGVGTKYIHSSFINPSGRCSYGDVGRSFGADADGLVFHKILFGKAGLGFAIQNLGPKINYKYGCRDALPLNNRTGVSYNISTQDLFGCRGNNWLSGWFYEKCAGNVCV